jgi:hypothetical protein
MTKPFLHIMKRPMTGRSPADNDHGVADCFLNRSRRSTITFSHGAAVHPLTRVLANEIVPARAVVVAAAIARLLFAGACPTAILARSANTTQRGRLLRHTLGDLCPNMAMVGIAAMSNSANADRRGR